MDIFRMKNIRESKEKKKSRKGFIKGSQGYINE